MIIVMALFTVTFVLPEAQAGAVVPAVETGVVPTAKGEGLKEFRQKVKKFYKEHSHEMQGMTKAEKKAFFEDHVGKSNQVPRKELLIIGIVLFLVGWILSGIFWGRSGFGNIAWLFGTIGTIVLLVWLILWLMDEL